MGKIKEIREMGDENHGAVQSISRAMTLVRLLMEHSELRFSELCTMSGLAHSTVARLLDSLQEEHLVVYERSTRRYRLSLQWLTIGSRALKFFDFVHMGQEQLTWLRDQTDETSHMALLEDDEIVFVAKVESRLPVRMNTDLGARVWAPCTAVGKALLATRPPEEVLSLLGPMPWPTFTDGTIHTPEHLVTHLAEVRHQGFAVDDEEHRKGIRCVAVAISGADGSAVAAVSISGPSHRIERDRIPAMAELLQSAAGRLGRQFGL